MPSVLKMDHWSEPLVQMGTWWRDPSWTASLKLGAPHPSPKANRTSRAKLRLLRHVQAEFLGILRLTSPKIVVENAAVPTRKWPETVLWFMGTPVIPMIEKTTPWHHYKYLEGCCLDSPLLLIESHISQARNLHLTLMFMCWIARLIPMILVVFSCFPSLL